LLTLEFASGDAPNAQTKDSPTSAAYVKPRKSPTENIDRSKLPELVVKKTPGVQFVIQDDDDDYEDGQGESIA